MLLIGLFLWFLIFKKTLAVSAEAQRERPCHMDGLLHAENFRPREQCRWKECLDCLGLKDVIIPIQRGNSSTICYELPRSHDTGRKLGTPSRKQQRQGNRRAHESNLGILCKLPRPGEEQVFRKTCGQRLGSSTTSQIL